MNGPSPENRDSLDELEKKLYRRDEPANFEAYRSHLTPERKVEKSLFFRRPSSAPETPATPGEPATGLSLGVKLFIGALLFFVFAAGLTAYYFLAGGNVVSADSIETTVEGPVSARGGDPVSLLIQFKNNNRVDLEYSNMTVEFPEGTRDVQNPTKDILRYDESVGALRSGEIVQKQVSALLFGDENEKKDIKVVLFYKPKGTSSTFKKETLYSVTIASSPVSVLLSLPRETNAGQTFDFELRVSSNTRETLRNVLLDVVFPPGFKFASSSIPPLSLNRTWNLGTLVPGKESVLRITGVIEGQDEEQKAFRVTVGTAGKSGESKVSVPYGSATRILVVKRPFLAIRLTGGTNIGEIEAIPDGATFSGVFSVANNLQESLSGFKAVLKLSGDAISRSSVIASDGFFRSTNNQIEWNNSTSEKIGTLDAGAESDLSFAFSTAGSEKGSSVARNRTVSLDLTITGTRTVAGVGKEDVSAHFQKSIPISSVLGFSERAVYSVGPFQNTGPIPPLVEQTTTYAVIWTLSNSANNLSGVTVKAKLPPYIEWKGVTSPDSEAVSYDTVTREIVWNVGALPAGVGYGAPGREVAFQIAFTPSLTQKDREPDLVGAATAGGTDDFTNVRLESIKRELTTNIASDPKFVVGQGTVR